MLNQASDNKRIAKNAIMLYVRMLLSILVSLYTSRIVLQTLGVVDYGIYGVVGGVVSMFAFLNASMSGATSRFITFALGKGDEDNIRNTFSTSLIIHVGIAFLIVLLSETIGLWLLENKLVIPAERMNAARWVYQFSIIAMAVQVMQVPYNASLISYEKMDIYAYIELLNVFLKLGIVYLLMICKTDMLILYSVLVLAVNIVVACAYRSYSVRHFATCKFKWIIDKKLLVPMLSFSGWDLYGNMCYSLRHQGVNVLINMFFGVTLNAASSVASSVQGVVSNLSANVIQAFRPQIIKQYALNKIGEMEALMCNSVKYSVILFAMIGVPLAYEMYPIMELWLGIVPECAPQFCIFLLAISLFNIINSVLCIAIHATGKIKYLSVFTGTIYLLTLPAIYLLFKYVSDSPLAAYIASLVTMILVVISNIVITKLQVQEFSVFRFGLNISWAFVLAAAASPILLISNQVENTIVHILISFSGYITMLTILTYFLGLSKDAREMINSVVITKFKR